MGEVVAKQRLGADRRDAIEPVGRREQEREHRLFPPTAQATSIADPQQGEEDQNMGRDQPTNEQKRNIVSGREERKERIDRYYEIAQ